jgi:hypothetical protein
LAAFGVTAEDACERLGENAPEPCKTIGGH